MKSPFCRLNMVEYCQCHMFQLHYHVNNYSKTISPFHPPRPKKKGALPGSLKSPASPDRRSGALNADSPPPISNQAKVLASASWNAARAVSWCDSPTARMLQSDADTDLGRGSRCPRPGSLLGAAQSPEIFAFLSSQSLTSPGYCVPPRRCSFCPLCCYLPLEVLFPQLCTAAGQWHARIPPPCPNPGAGQG